MKSIFLILVISSLFVLVCVGFQKKNSDFKIQLSDFNYKFPVNDTSTNSELDIFEKRIGQIKNPTDIDLATLADMYTSEAKRVGSIAYYDKAEDVAKAAIKLNEKNKTAQLVLLKIKIARHQFLEALADIDKIFGKVLHEDSAALRTSIFMALGQFPEAMVQINYLLKAKPDIGSATLKALVLSHVGQDDLAVYYFKRALQIEDLNEELQSVFTRAQLAQFLIKKGNYEQAIDLCDMALKIIPTNSFVQFVKAEALTAKKKYQLAFELYQNAFAQSKEPVYLLHMVFMSKILKKEEDFKVLADQALRIYQMEVQNNQYGHLLDLAELHYVMDNYQDALKVLMQNRELRKNLRSEVLLAKTLIKLNKPDQAKEILEAEIASGSTNVSLFYLMIDILKGEHNKALREIYVYKINMNNSNYNSDILMVIP